MFSTCTKPRKGPLAEAASDLKKPANESDWTKSADQSESANDQLERMRRIAFFSVIFSTVAAIVCIVCIPAAYNYIQYIQSTLEHEMNFCKAKSSNIMKTVLDTELLKYGEPVGEVAHRLIRNTDAMGFWYFGKFFPDGTPPGGRAQDEGPSPDSEGTNFEGEKPLLDGEEFGDFERLFREGPPPLATGQFNVSGSGTDSNAPNLTKPGVFGSASLDSESASSSSWFVPRQTTQGPFFIARDNAPPIGGCCTCQQGPVGPPGPPGKDGKDGEDGANGPDGPPGNDAPPAATEAPPPTCTTCPPPQPGLPGPKGPKGPPGSAGTNGNGGVAVPGPRGPIGPPGLPGKDGDPGPKGGKGPDGKLTTVPGPEGPPGPQGPKGPDGEPGVPGEPGKPASVGPPGLVGDPGDPGSPGKSGIPGPPGKPGDRGHAGSCTHCPPARLAPGY